MKQIGLAVLVLSLGSVSFTDSADRWSAEQQEVLAQIEDCWAAWAEARSPESPIRIPGFGDQLPPDSAITIGRNTQSEGPRPRSLPGTLPRGVADPGDRSRRDPEDPRNGASWAKGSRWDPGRPESP